MRSTIIPIAALIVSCFIALSDDLLAQATYCEDEIPPIIFLNQSYPASADNAQIASHSETQITPIIYDENGDISMDSCGPFMRLNSESMTKAGIRNMVPFLKACGPNKTSSHLGVYLQVKHLNDIEFQTELKSLLPNCAFFDGERDPWGKFLLGYEWEPNKKVRLVSPPN